MPVFSTSARISPGLLEERTRANALPGLARSVGGLDERLHGEPIVRRNLGKLAAVDSRRKPAEEDRTNVHRREASECLPAVRPQPVQRAQRVDERFRLDGDVAVRPPETELCPRLRAAERRRTEKRSKRVVGVKRPTEFSYQLPDWSPGK